MVAIIRGSVAGRKPTIGIIRFDASRSSEPKYWVKAPAPSLQPCRITASWMVSRVRCQPSTRSSAPSRPASSMARSRAAQHIILEYRKSCAGPRISQMPWSWSVQRRAAVSATATRKSRVAGSRAVIWSRSRGRRHHFAVHVNLALGPGPVAHAHRRAVPPPGQVGELPLGQVPLAAHPEHDLQVNAPPQRRRSGHGQEGEEFFRLVWAGRHPQRVHGQRGVADPGKAVVPVAVAADGFRKRGRWSGDDRAGGVEGQRLQHPAAVMDELGPGPGVTLVQGRPRTPGGHRVGQPTGQLGW